MKVSSFFLVALVGLTTGQEVRYDSAIQWPQNRDTLAGAIIGLTYAEVGNGSCIVELPSAVNLFHVMNGFIVTGDITSTVEGRYKISAPTHWSLANGTFNVLILFARDQIFDLEDISFSCDPSDVSDINVYSFPQNNLMGEASSTICFRPAFHQGDVLTITFPTRVKEFNVTTWDSAFTLTSEDNITFTLTGFKAPFDNDYNTEVSFHLVYNIVNGIEDWFAAGDITVRVDRAPTPTPVEV